MNQIAQYLPSRIGTEIEREAKLVRIHVAEEAGVIGSLRVVVEGSNPARGLDPVGGFDPHDGGSEVGHGAGRSWTRDDPHQVEHLETGKCALAGHGG